MPWYYYLLMIIPIKSIADHIFSITKADIKEEQKGLKEKNIVCFVNVKKRNEEKKKLKIMEMFDITIKDSITEKLDHFYFSNKNIPLDKEIKLYYPELDDNRFHRILDDYGFKILSLNPNFSEHGKIVVYPHDTDWQWRKAKLKSLANRLVEDLNQDFIMKDEKITLAKAMRLKAYLDKTHFYDKENKIDDPYKKLEKEIKILNEKEEKEELEKQDGVE